MFKPLEIVGDTAFRTTDQKVRGSNPFERARQIDPQMRVNSFLRLNYSPVDEICAIFL